MAQQTTKEPWIPDNMLEKWPAPDGFGRRRWGRLSLEERKRFLVDNAYVKEGSTWVPRADPVHPEAAEQVQQAVTTVHGAGLVVREVFEEVKEEGEWQFCPRCGNRYERGSRSCSTCDAPRRAPEEQSDDRIVSQFSLLWVVGVLVLAFVIAALMTDLFGVVGGGDAAAPSDVSAPPGGTVESAGDAAEGDAPEIPTHAELAAQEPIPLTEGTWRFFAHTDESAALYDFQFFADGTVIEFDAADHTSGTYAVSGATVEIAVTRTEEVFHSIPGRGERREMASWTEWFTMSRTGNTMTGSWTGQSWSFDFDDGFELGEVRNRNLEGQVVFARPERPDDVG